jgi:hypothetical protein
MDSGVATRPITDWDAYRAKLSEFVYHTGVGMRAIFQAARQAKGKRIIFAEGEDERVLRAAQVVIEEKFARPILIGRPASSSIVWKKPSCASSRASISISSIRSRTSVFASAGRPTTS